MAHEVERADSTRMVQLGRGVVLLVVGGVVALVALIASIASFTWAATTPRSRSRSRSGRGTPWSSSCVPRGT